MRMKQRGSSAFTLLAVDVPKGRGVEVGHWSTVDEARDAATSVAYWEIWRGDTIVDRHYPAGY